MLYYRLLNNKIVFSCVSMHKTVVTSKHFQWMICKLIPFDIHLT